MTQFTTFERFVDAQGKLTLPAHQRLTELETRLAEVEAALANYVLKDTTSDWTAATGTATRTTFATGSVTLPQLAERVKALLDDNLASGVIK